MIPQNDHNNLPVIDFKHMKISSLSKKEFKIADLSKLSELQENTKSQFRGAWVAQSVKHLTFDFVS